MLWSFGNQCRFGLVFEEMFYESHVSPCQNMSKTVYLCILNDITSHFQIQQLSPLAHTDHTYSHQMTNCAGLNKQISIPSTMTPQREYHFHFLLPKSTVLLPIQMH